MKNLIEKENEKKHIEFKRKVIYLVILGRRVDRLFLEGKITKREKSKRKKLLSWEWDKAYNRHPNVSQSIKQGFNLLYS